MNEVFEKIIEKLEEKRKSYEGKYGMIDFQIQEDFKDAIKIVQEVAEEYNGGWIPCSSGKMPEERDSIFKKFKETNKWSNSMFEKSSDSVIITVSDEEGNVTTTHGHTIDGKWACNLLRMNETYRVIAWRYLPEPYKEREENE